MEDKIKCRVRCLTPLDIKKIQIKIMGYLCVPIRVAKIKRSDNKYQVLSRMWNNWNPHKLLLMVNIKCYSHFGRLKVS